MSRTADLLLGGLRIWPTADGALIVECARSCPHSADVDVPASVTDVLAAGRHDCPMRGEVAASVLASLEAPVPVGGGR